SNLYLNCARWWRRAEPTIGVVDPGPWRGRDLRVPKESGGQWGGIGTLTLGTIRRYHAHSCALRHEVPVRVPCQPNWHPGYDWPRPWAPPAPCVAGSPVTGASGW